MKHYSIIIFTLLSFSCTNGHKNNNSELAYTFRIKADQENKDGKKQDAFTDYAKAIELNPQYDSAYFNRAVMYHQLRQYEQALTGYRKALKVTPKPLGSYATNMYINISNIYFLQQKYILAQKNYDEGIAALPNAGPLYYERGMIKQRLGDKEGALKDYDKAIDIGHYVSAYIYRGSLKNEMGDHQGAIDDYTLVIQNDSTSIKSLANYYKRGLIYNTMKKNNLAISDFNKALQLAPKPLDETTASIYMNIGYIYYNEGKFNLALDCFNQIIKISENGKAYCNRGNIKNRLGDKKGAIADYTKAIELNPTDGNNYYNRGVIYASIGTYTLAVTDFEKVLDLPSNQVDANTTANLYLNLGEIYYRKNLLDLSLKNLNSGLEVAPQDGRIFYERALVKKKMKDEDGACEDLHQAKKLGFPQADALLKTCS